MCKYFFSINVRTFTKYEYITQQQVLHKPKINKMESLKAKKMFSGLSIKLKDSDEF